jgi:hypothetical protein
MVAKRLTATFTRIFFAKAVERPARRDSSGSQYRPAVVVSVIDANQTFIRFSASENRAPAPVRKANRKVSAELSAITSAGMPSRKKDVLKCA